MALEFLWAAVTVVYHQFDFLAGRNANFHRFEAVVADDQGELGVSGPDGKKHQGKRGKEQGFHDTSLDTNDNYSQYGCQPFLPRRVSKRPTCFFEGLLEICRMSNSARAIPSMVTLSAPAACMARMLNDFAMRRSNCKV